MSFDAKLKALHIELPMAPKPVANYVPVVRAGDLLFLSGVLPARAGEQLKSRQHGDGITITQGM
jgi:enamine deaminase RidA (YjgF/YER057c/UK114 family)